MNALALAITPQQLTGADSFRAWLDRVLDEREQDGVRGIESERNRADVRIRCAPFAPKPLEQIPSAELREWLRAMQRKKARDTRGDRELTVDTVARFACRSEVRRANRLCIRREQLSMTRVNACISGVKCASRLAPRQTRTNKVCRRYPMGRTHGESARGGTPEWRVWRSMINRCHQPSATHFAEYGGRGIRVCDEWRTSFEVFLAAVGRRPSPEHTIDRIDVDGNYEPGNVRWATWHEQHRNQRSNRFVEIDGERLCIADWEKRSPVSFVAICRRLDAGWPPRDAVFAPNQNDGERPLRAKPDFIPWTCLLCGCEFSDQKAPNTRVCKPCTPPRAEIDRLRRAGRSYVPQDALLAARAAAKLIRAERKNAMSTTEHSESRTYGGKNKS